MKKKIKYRIFFLELAVLILFPIIIQAREAYSEAFGVNLHLRNRFYEAKWETALNLASEAGVQWAREEFSWDVIEPTNNEYHWEVYDNIIDQYQSKNIKVLGLLSYSTVWASTNPGSSDYDDYVPDLKLWRDYVKQVATHYKGKVSAWEIWNEPNNSGFWRSSREDYADLLETASIAIREADPDAQIVFGGLSGADTSYLNDLYGLIDDKNIFDVVAVHPYRLVGSNYNYPPEITQDGLNSLTTDLTNILTVINNNGDAGKPIWLTELGWTTYDSGLTNVQQADYLMRGYLTALSVPTVQKVFWYTFRDDSKNSEYLESEFGLIDQEYQKKESYYTFQFLKKYLDGKKFQPGSLGNEYLLDDFNNLKDWEFTSSIDTEGVMKNSNGQLEVYYRFIGAGNSFLPIKKEMHLKRGTRVLSFRAKGTDNYSYLRVRIIDHRGEVFQYNLGYLPSNWVTYRLDLNNYSVNWGGDGDSKLDEPLDFSSFVLDDNPDGAKISGYAYFDDLKASKLREVYLYHYLQNKKHSYFIWTIKGPKTKKVFIDNAKTVRLRNTSNTSLLTSANNYFSININNRPQFLQIK